MLDVACAVQGSYVPHSAAMLHSLCGPGVRAHYLHGPDLRRASRRRLERMVAATGGEIVFWEIADERVEGLRVHGYFTSAMWYRILLPELLPDVERVLYLDVDTLALDSIAPLWDVDLDGALVAAVTNLFEAWRGTEHTDALGLDQSDYFNSGVLLLHLDEMRRSDTVSEIRRVAAERADQLLWPDQDVLNLVLGPRRVPLAPRWNAMNSVFLFDHAAEVFGEQAVAEARDRPAIRHFEGPGANKPWDRGAAVPHVADYRAHRRATPWRSRLVRP
ncbi:MAG: ral stress protein [Solirubrobacterales bacterium]|nr:ral stress protein [Solirubrobacterales bacterium]